MSFTRTVHIGYTQGEMMGYNNKNKPSYHKQTAAKDKFFVNLYEALRACSQQDRNKWCTGLFGSKLVKQHTKVCEAAKKVPAKIEGRETP